MGKRSGAYRGLVGRPEGEIPLARPIRRWLIKAWGMHRIYLPQDRDR
jgi:hypothetical protein